MTKGNYSYPLDSSWSTEEITTVLHFLSQVEKAYESKVDRDQLLQAYTAFKTVVPGKAPEKQLDKAFEEASGFSTYQAVKAAKAKDKDLYHLENKLIFAKEIIKEAGAFIKESLSKTITVEEKTAFDDLVTNIDKQTQDLLVARIKSSFPSDNIFAEENGLVHNIKDGNVWVLDPIDGTVNFIVQQDNFCVMIAYYEEGQGKFGLIYNVIADQLFYGGGQFDVYCNDKLLPAYKNRPLDRCLVASNGAMYAKNFHGLKDLIDKTLGVRVYGGAGLSMSKVLSGQILAYFSVIYPWDYAAASIMGEKLGYHLETITGEPLDYFSRQAVMLVPKDRLEEIKHIMGSEN